MRLVALLRPVSILLLSSLLLAGCAQKPTASETATTEVPEAFENVVVTSSTGAIRGLVLTPAIVPIEGASVTLKPGDKTTMSDAQGAFVFQGLEAGTYFLAIHKLGYFDAQTSTDVVAGLEDPPIVKVQLQVDVANQPFTELQQWDGFFACGAGSNAYPGGVGVNPCAIDAITCSIVGVCLLGSSNTHQFDFGPGRVPDWAQAEAVWEGTQPLGNELNLGWFDEGTSDFKGGSGPSPLVVGASKEEILDAHDENITGLLARIFPGSNTELTVTLQQRFTVYATYFYGFVPREGWAFVIDGNCGSPDDCA